MAGINFSTLTEATATDLYTASHFLALVSGAWKRVPFALVRRGQKAINAQTGTSYTLVLADADKFVTLSNASSITLTVPTNASVAFPIGTEIVLMRGGAGQITVAGDGGVTVRFGGSNRDNFNGQYAVCYLLKIGTDEWVFHGDTSAT